jgi:hypothetical protein
MDDSNRITLMINHVPESDFGPCPENDDEGGDDIDLTAESDCVCIISDYDQLDDANWNRKKHGNFTFMYQDAYDDLPTLVDDDDVHQNEYTLDWVEEGETPEPTDKMADTPGSLRKGRENNWRASIVALMSTLPLLFWKISVGQSNKFAHQEMEKAKDKWKPENVTHRTKWRHDITLNLWCLWASYFTCASSLCLTIHMCCNGRMAPSHTLL